MHVADELRLFVRIAVHSEWVPTAVLVIGQPFGAVGGNVEKVGAANEVGTLDCDLEVACATDATPGSVIRAPQTVSPSARTISKPNRGGGASGPQRGSP
jgi:hypothetical protein